MSVRHERFQITVTDCLSPQLKRLEETISSLLAEADRHKGKGFWQQICDDLLAFSEEEPETVPT